MTISSVPVAVEAPSALRRNTLGLPHAIIISVAVMSPAASIFFNTIPQAGVVGAALPLCYVIGFIIALFVANQVSEMARELPSSGSAYTFVTVGLGPRWGFFTGWIGLLAIAIGVPFSFVFMSYNLEALIVRWFGVDIHWSIYFVAAVGLVFALAYAGIRQSLRLDIGFVIFEFGICLLLAGLIFWQARQVGTISALPFTLSGIPQNGSLAVGIVLSVLSFIGFETAATLGEETREPHRNIPRAVYGSMIVVGLFYILMAYAATIGYGVNNMATGYFKDPAPFDTLGRHVGGALGGSAGSNIITSLIDVVGVLGFFSAALAIVNGGSRIIYAVGRDGLLPRWTAWTHPQRNTPAAAIGLLCGFGLLCGIPLGLKLQPINAYGFLGTMDAILSLIIYLLISVACMRFFLKQRRAQFSFVRHGILPVLSMVITGGILAAVVASPGDAALSYIPIIVGIYVILGVIGMAMQRPKAA